MITPFTILLAAAITYTTKTDCKDVTYQPAPNVAYQEGVDSKGWMVAPADLNPPALTNEDFKQVEIPLNIPLSDYPTKDIGADELASHENPNLDNAWIQPGYLSADTQTGEASMNGKLLNTPCIDCNQ